MSVKHLATCHYEMGFPCNCADIQKRISAPTPTGDPQPGPAVMPNEIETAVKLLNGAQRYLELIPENVEEKSRVEKAIHDALVFLRSTKNEIVPVDLKELEEALRDKQTRIINCLKEDDLREAWKITYIAAHHHRQRMLYGDRAATGPQGAPSPAPAGVQGALSAILERLRDTRDYLVTLPPGLRNEATRKALSCLRLAVSDLVHKCGAPIDGGSPGTVQAPAAGPLDPEWVVEHAKLYIEKGDKEGATHWRAGLSRFIARANGVRYGHAKVTPLAGAPSAGRPMKLTARMDGDVLQVEKASGLSSISHRWHMSMDLAAEIAYRINAFEGAGRPMTWTREAVESYLTELVKTWAVSQHPYYRNAYAALSAFLSPETSASESVRPEAEPSTRSQLTPSDSQLAPAPIREAKADPGPDHLADLLAGSPKARAKLFESEAKRRGWEIPPPPAPGKEGAA